MSKFLQQWVRNQRGYLPIEMGRTQKSDSLPVLREFGFPIEYARFGGDGDFYMVDLPPSWKVLRKKSSLPCACESGVSFVDQNGIPQLVLSCSILGDYTLEQTSWSVKMVARLAARFARKDVAQD